MAGRAAKAGADGRGVSRAWGAGRGAGQCASRTAAVNVMAKAIHHAVTDAEEAKELGFVPDMTGWRGGGAEKIEECVWRSS